LRLAIFACAIPATAIYQTHPPAGFVDLQPEFIPGKLTNWQLKIKNQSFLRRFIPDGYILIDR
jgi:hypothetical protein